MRTAGGIICRYQRWRAAALGYLHGRPSVRLLPRERNESGAVEEVLLDLVRLLSTGPSVAADAGEKLLRGSARRLWRDAPEARARSRS